MSITETFAGVAVADFPALSAWYERLFGRPPDMIPHESEVAWKLTEGGWIYVVGDPERAGGSLVTLLVDDLDAELARLVERGIEAGPIETIPGKVRRANVTDPEGNLIAFAQPLGSTQ